LQGVRRNSKVFAGHYEFSCYEVCSNSLLREKNWMKQEKKKHQIALKAGAAEGKTELEYIVRC
jgi:hypothetical protein